MSDTDLAPSLVKSILRKATIAPIGRMAKVGRSRCTGFNTIFSHYYSVQGLAVTLDTMHVIHHDSLSASQPSFYAVAGVAQSNFQSLTNANFIKHSCFKGKFHLHLDLVCLIGPKPLGVRDRILTCGRSVHLSHVKAFCEYRPSGDLSGPTVSPRSCGICRIARLCECM